MNKNEFHLDGGGKWWYNHSAPHVCSELTSKECSELLKKGGYFVSNTYDFDCKQETNFWWVIKDSFGGFEELSSKMRNQVKKSLKTYDVEKVDGAEIARIGLEIDNRAKDGYRVKSKRSSQAEMDNYINAPSEREFWAVYTKEGHKPVAFAVNTIENGDCCGYNKMKCDPMYQHNSTYPYYALIYIMNEYYLQERKLKYVNDGRRSLSERSNIQPFLIEKFKFRRAYCRLQVKYKWWFAIIINVLYPFRKFIKNQQVAKLLKQEAMRRKQY